jgi:hypothetical protein
MWHCKAVSKPLQLQQQQLHAIVWLHPGPPHTTLTLKSHARPTFAWAMIQRVTPYMKSANTLII